MNLDIESMNERLFNSAAHLAEAAKYMSDIDKEMAMKFMATADKMLSIIKPVPEKLEQSYMDSIMDEIFKLGEK